MLVFCSAMGQEFRCAVTVNPQKLLTTTQAYESAGDKKIFDNMKQALEDFINGRRWTNLEFQQQEKIDCSFSLILQQRNSATDFVAQISIQMRRPVYNSTYTTGLFNYMEQPTFSFSYNESQPLDFDPNNFSSILASTVAYYCYVMLGIYFDRYWFMENHTNSAYAPLREAYYNYHRLGLDMMTRDQPAARQAILQALKALQQVHRRNTSMLSLQQFVDVKIQEIISIFTPAPPEEQKVVYNIIRDISPINVSKLKGFNTK